MKRTDQLHELIKSLSQTEKRYFKMFSNMRGKGGTNYLNLFEAIERMKVYDESRLKEKFKGSTLSKHLPSEKNYLYHLILKSLRAYHSDATKNNELSNLLQSIEILFDKGMFTHCLKLLAKARKLAYRYEKHTLLLDILKWEQKITRARFDLDNLEENVDETLAEEHRILSDLQAIAQYKISFYKLTTFIDNRGIARSESELQRLDNIMSGDFIRSIENATSYEGRIYYYLSWADYHYARGNLKEDYKISQELVNFIESKPELLQQDKRPHINGLSYLAIACTRIGMFDEARKALNDLKKYLQPSQHLSRDLEVRTYSLVLRLELSLFRVTGEFEKGYELAKQISDALQSREKSLSKEQELMVFFYMAFFFWSSNDRKKTLHYLNRIFESKEREDILCFARILNIISHFEMGNTLILGHIIRSTKSFLQRRKKLFQSELLVLKYIDKMAGMNSDAEKRECFIALGKAMDETLKDPYERTVLDYMDLSSWITSHVENIPFAEVVRKKNGGKKKKD